MVDVFDLKKYPAEPFKIKTVETVKTITKEDREKAIKEAGLKLSSIQVLLWFFRHQSLLLQLRIGVYSYLL